jgi:hypothetical protein
MEWEDHTIHLKTHSDFMKNREKYEKLPPIIQQLFVAHRGQHQQYLLKEQQAAMMVGSGGQFPPPALPPVSQQGGGSAVSK